MTKATQPKQTTIPGTTAAEHEKYVDNYRSATAAECGGLLLRCVAVALIRSSESWTSVASSFEDFVEKDLGIKRAYAHRLASAGPMCSQLIEQAKKKKSTIVDFRIEHFKPIAGMDKWRPKDYAKTQAGCLLKAHAAAEKRGEVLTAAHVTEVAKSQYAYVSRAEWKRKNKNKTRPSHEDNMAKYKQLLVDAFMMLADFPLTAEEIVEEWGNPSDLPGFNQARNRIKDLAEHAY